jgi:hypothetical protein
MHKIPTKDNFILFFALTVLGLFFLKSFESLFPFEHGDALYYHLVGAKITYFYSWGEMWKDLLLYIQAGIFDLFYLLPFTVTHSLLKVQMIGQWWHFFCSLGLGSYYLLKELSYSVWGYLAALCLLTISKDSDFFYYAKNDGALACSILIAYISLTHFSENKNNIRYLLKLGCYLSLIPLIKMNGVYALFFLYILFILKNKNDEGRWRTIIIVSGLITMGVMILFFRNFYYAGNPFFPIFLKHFPGKLSAPMVHHFSTYYGNSMGLSLLGGHLSDLFMGKVIFLAAPFLFFLNYKIKKPELNESFLICMGIFGLYLLTNGSLRHPRYFFACYFLLTYFLFVSLRAHVECMTNIKSKKKVILLIFLLIVVDSKIDKTFKRNQQVWNNLRTKTDKEIVLENIPFAQFSLYMGGLSDSLETKKRPLFYVISDSLSDSYYLPDGGRLHTSLQTPQAAFLESCTTKENLALLKMYRYAILLHDKDNLCYQQIKNDGRFLVAIRGHSLYQIF